ncbi:MAG TPA: sulfotransferase [Rhizomicrobium sp.]
MSSRPIDSARSPPPIFLEIDQAMRARDFRRAVALTQQALDAGYSSPGLFSLRARWRKLNGEASAAIADLERALALDPRSATILGEIADCLNGLGHHSKALEAADEAVSCEPAYVLAWFQKALAHQMLNQLQDARAAYLEAVRLDPRMAAALGRLAAMAVQQNQHDEARDYARQALEIEPGQDVATLALITLDMADDALDDADTHLRTLLADPRTTQLTRSIALSHLGDLRDREQHWPEAFAAYREAGHIWNSIYATRFKQPGREAVPDMLTRLRAAVKTQPPSAPRPCATDAAGLAFILGFPRSGTTLLGQILASRSDVAVFEEKPLLTRAIRELIEARDGLAKLAGLPDSALDAYREDFWKRVRQSGIDVTGKLVVDQTAFNTAYLPAIRRLFPKAPIIFALRDPRDVAFSCFRRMFAPNLFTLELHSLEGAARLYDAMMRFVDVCRERTGFAPLEIRNEDLIADFDGVTKQLCEHLGLAWDESLRDFQEATHDRLLATRSATQVRRGLSSEGVGQWRNYREQIAPVLGMLKPWVRRFDYPAE